MYFLVKTDRDLNPELMQMQPKDNEIHKFRINEFHFHSLKKSDDSEDFYFF